QSPQIPINNLLKFAPKCGQSCFHAQSDNKPFTLSTLRAFCHSSTSGILLLNCINSNCGRKTNTNWISDLSAMTPILQQTAMTCSAIRNEDLNSTADSFISSSIRIRLR
ncbi:hypothetical protein BCR33DRAFT_719087, partial [Rhizoclosmatium globosum]